MKHSSNTVQRVANIQERMRSAMPEIKRQIEYLFQLIPDIAKKSPAISNIINKI